MWNYKSTGGFRLTTCAKWDNQCKNFLEKSKVGFCDISQMLSIH